jgi:hypothetical protein
MPTSFDDSGAGRHIVMTTSWSKRFYDPILLADGRRLVTLQDAADYIASLLPAERDADDWKLAMEALTLAARRRDYERLAPAVVMKALEPAQPGDVR